MEFHRVIGKPQKSLVVRAQNKLTKVLLDISSRYDNNGVGSMLGGDPLVSTLMVTGQHVCTMNMPTAATDGKRFYWNPEFIMKKSRLGIRFVCAHEAWHAIYMHPTRRGSRHPQLWNIAVDYIVNWNVLEDIKARNKNSSSNNYDPEALFREHLGDFKTVEEYAAILKDPFFQGDKMAQPTYDTKSGGNNSKNMMKLPHPNKEVDLTEEQKNEIERRMERKSFFYADPDLVKEYQRPEALYNYFLSLIPKCPECGKLGMYKRNKDNSKKDKSDSGENTKGKGQEKGQEEGQGEGQGEGEGHDHGDSGDSCNHGGCGTCGDSDYVDVFGLGGTVDDHMDSEESEEKMAGKISEAIHSVKKMAGHIPASLEDELGSLTEPKISWKDVVRIRQLKARAGNTKNDWSRFKRRPMFAGLLTPQRISYSSNITCLVDTSGSMSREDIALGVSQLASLDDNNEMTMVPADCIIYWDKATKLKKVTKETLATFKVVGRGGTIFSSFFSDYKKNVGDSDFLIVITDGYLCDTDIANMVDPGVEVIWLITSGCDFQPPFGKAFELLSL